MLPGESKALQQYITEPGSPFQKLHLDKNQLLCDQGETCNHFTFVVGGILQHGIEVNGDEKTTYLALRNSFTSALESFLNRVPSRKFIKAIVATDLLYVDRNTFEKLMSEDVIFRQAYFDLIQKQICLIDDYRIDLLTLTPEERYQKLLSTEPVLLQQVPLHLLSSFLGISMRHMSRIRKNIK
ncbi:Crp/Fnr family transcriptional regulator [Flavobacterium silvaticum]|uniref:Crp/Fnr family transcriptional regulator n=1 Tax=Flavobacterium silvaticum TaxID=1852020 RepID=A0A972FQS0_9FLAO|nr:Crp/Fnr family transcriptional regulator [Flavobacterium silvaticum]NMH27649.1 Crp/Fnr family transcriptional regulator [Flavobacterium silvaticum]